MQKNVKRTRPLAVKKKSSDTLGIQPPKVKLDLRKKLKLDESSTRTSTEKPPPLTSMLFDLDEEAAGFEVKIDKLMDNVETDKPHTCGRYCVR